MIKSLQIIKNIKSNKDVDCKHKWLLYLYVTKEQNYNLNHVKSLSEITNKSVLNYVTKSLEILNEEKISKKNLFYVEEALKWMDVAKCGTKTIRKEWIKKGYDLFVHNIGSSQIYRETNDNIVVETLIKTHGLIGQYIKGEVNIDKNKELYLLIERKLISKEDLREILYVLNKCIIKSISDKIWNTVEKQVIDIIEKIINNEFEADNYYDVSYIVNRLSKLRTYATEEEKDELKKYLSNNDSVVKVIGMLFERIEIWFLDSALSKFKFEEIIKILFFVGINIKDDCKHLTFENVMKSIYLDYNNNKEINLYKKRIIEKYLLDMSIDDIKNNNIQNNHLYMSISTINGTAVFDFNFSIVSKKLIEFCEVAYETDSLFNKAVFMLYDLFGFRRDQYDRFYNEISYLKTMNSSISKKTKILDYINGKSILDVGPGGGALMDLIAERFIDADVYGIDIAENVIEALKNKKSNENKRWNLIKGDALYLDKYIEKNKVDTIIYSSIIHELYSYIPFEGKKFNRDTIEKALTSAYDILPVGGRIIIRDGIMTEEKEQKRIIRFKNKDDIKILDRYCNDFKGRKITYEKIKEDEAMMYVNDAMEFLYTYTWGEDSYNIEVQEQFGYFTPNEYVEFIKRIFNNKCNIIECIHFLQDGYEEHLLEKIDFFDENYIPTRLPDSTCIIVIEKR